jgi:PH (Pleckstrin Homology) domain-containing protein
MHPITLLPTGTTRRIIGYPVVATALPLIAFAHVTGLVVGVALIAAYIALYIKLGKARLELDAAGVTARGAFSTRSIRWDDVQSYTFSSIDPSANMNGAAGGLVGALAVAAVRALQKSPGHRMFKGGRLTLRGRDGTKLAVPAGKYHGLIDALDGVFAELHARIGPAATSFGDLSFDGKRLRHVRKGELEVSEIDRIVVASTAAISIYKVGKRFAWASTHMTRTDNSMLLFERLMDRSVKLELAPGVFLPTPTLALITHAAATRSALPQATVHKH